MSWPVCKIADVFDVARGGSPRPIQSYLTDAPDGLNWIMIGDASGDSKYISTTKNRIKPEGLKKTRMVHEGDFLLTNSMSFGRPYILKTSGCIHDGWLVLSPKSDQVSPDFFYYLLGSDTLYREFTKRAAGAVVKNLNSALVRNVQIPLPPLAEQKRIAGILDAADALREKRRESLAQLDTLLQSTFLEMFGDPVTNPMGWEIGRVGDLTSVGSGAGFPNKYQGEASGDFPFYKVSDMNLPGNERQMQSHNNAISDEVRAALRAKSHPPGTIIFPKIGAAIATNKKRILTASSCFDNNVIGIHPTSRIAVEYFFELIQTKDLMDFANPGNPPSIRKTAIEDWIITLPPLDAQRRFAAIVQSIEHQRASQRAHLDELDTLFASLQSRAFRGDL